jgi:hypothetical protein
MFTEMGEDLNEEPPQLKELMETCYEEAGIETPEEIEEWEAKLAATVEEKD